MSSRGVLRVLESGYVAFRCPGCERKHVIQVGEGRAPRWSFDGNFDRPTFSPSILVTYPGPDAGQDGAPPAVCHSFVTDGQVRFLNDCTHALAGQTVPLAPMKDD